MIHHPIIGSSVQHHLAGRSPDFSRPCARATLAADYHPVNILKAKLAERREERLYRQETNGRASFLQMRNPRRGLRVFNGNAEPNMCWGRPTSVTIIDELL